ncbi:hypothetical protein BJ170DRAFT_608163 [Xylariales sp. AK1849]|nr:hypothetical protein BJ170DRAFT_608163 [Xylariales sp. AK1849]
MDRPSPIAHCPLPTPTDWLAVQRVGCLFLFLQSIEPTPPSLPRSQLFVHLLFLPFPLLLLTSLPSPFLYPYLPLVCPHHPLCAEGILIVRCWLFSVAAGTRICLQNKSHRREDAAQTSPTLHPKKKKKRKKGRDTKGGLENLAYCRLSSLITVDLLIIVQSGSESLSIAYTTVYTTTVILSSSDFEPDFRGRNRTPRSTKENPERSGSLVRPRQPSTSIDCIGGQSPSLTRATHQDSKSLFKVRILPIAIGCPQTGLC